MSNQNKKPHVPLPQIPGQCNFTFIEEKAFACLLCPYKFPSRNHLNEHTGRVFKLPTLNSLLEYKSLVKNKEPMIQNTEIELCFFIKDDDEQLKKKERFLALPPDVSVFFVDDDLPYIYDKDKIITPMTNHDGNIVETVVVDQKIAKFKSVSILGQKYNSLEATSFRGSYIQAYFRDTSQNTEDHQLRPAQIQFFFRHSMSILNNNNQLQTITFTLAYVRWYKDLIPGSLVTTFDTINSRSISNNFTDPSYMDILPIQCIYSPIGIHLDVIDNHNITINIPRRITE